MHNCQIELSVFSKRCLIHRIGGMDTLRHEVTARTNARHAAQTGVDRQFTKDWARITPQHLSPRVTLR